MSASTQWFKNGDHPKDYEHDEHGFENGELRVFTGAERKALKWEGAVVRYFRDPCVDGYGLCVHCGQRIHDHGWIDSGDRGRTVCPGDYIVTDDKGQHYPCKPDLLSVLMSQVTP